MRPTFLFLLISFFAVTAATAQLYDNRSRYLQTPYDSIRFEKKPYQTQNTILNNYQSNLNSYNNYRNRVNTYAPPKLDSKEFYELYREPSEYNKYNINTTGSNSKSEFDLKDCHCNFRVDINDAFRQWYRAQQMARAALLRGYETLFKKKIENILNKQFPDFKEAQKEFFKEYVKIGDNRHRSIFIPIIEKDYKDQINLLEKNTAFYNVSKAEGAHTIYEKLSLFKLQTEADKSAKDFLISKELYENRYTNNLPYHGYMVDQFIKHYNKENNYEFKLGSFNGYIEHFQNQVGYGTVLRPTHNYGRYMLGLYDYDENEVLNYMKDLLRQEMTFNDYKPNYSLEYSKAIVAFYTMTFPERTIFVPINAGRSGIIKVPKKVAGTPLKCQENRSISNNEELNGIKEAILNKTPLKKAVFRYLANAKSHRDGQKTVLEAVGCRLKNSAFEWSELSHLPHIKLQDGKNPEIIMSIKLKKRVAPSFLYDDGIDGEMVIINNILWKEYNMHQGIADVLKYIYNVEKYWGVEGATIRHFLKEKGLNVPSSLSDHDLGTLFDFGGGNTDYLTIEFSDFAKKFITNFQHYDGKYGWSLFTDLVKLKKLHDILKGKPVDFSNIKEPCIGDPVPNPEIAPQTNSGIQGGMHDTCARWNENTICKGIKGRKWHNGVDIKNPYGAPIYAIYDGVATKHVQRDDKGNLDGAGYYSVVESKVNGKNVRMVYFHLKDTNRTTGTVKAGDIIGYQGDSGNLKNGILQGHAISHLHIKTQVNGVDDNPLKHIKTKIDPDTGKVINLCN